MGPRTVLDAVVKRKTPSPRLRRKYSETTENIFRI
jgi:hypothetical protein